VDDVGVERSALSNAPFPLRCHIQLGRWADFDCLRDALASASADLETKFEELKLAHKILNRLRREIRHAAAFARARMFDTQPDENDVLAAWHKHPPSNLRACVEEWIAGKPCVFADDLKNSEDVRKVCGEADRLIDGPNLILQSPCSLKPPALWHCDPLTGQSWPAKVHFTRFRVFHPSRDGVTDIRRLWEVGRFGWALPLARAFSITGDPKYAKAWSDHAESFIKENPPEFGPHWLNAMEVSIRVIQWCRALTLFFRVPSAECRVPGGILPSLLAHGRYIRTHLEWTPQGRTNHYIADLVGLLAQSVFLPQFRESTEWRRFAIHGLTHEIETQTDTDGFHAEASTAYHHFALELYALTVAMDRQHHLDFPSRFHKRVRHMIETDMAIRGPENIDPRIGDDDSGTLLISDWGAHAARMPISAARRDAPSHALRSSGIYILRSDALSCHVACGPNGQEGVGGHAHNDKLSVVIRLQEREIVVDSGTFCYSADTAMRDRFRSTAMHNTLMVDGREQNPLEDWRMLRDRTRAKELLWKDSSDETVFQGEHSGYQEIGVIHRRTITLDKRGSRLFFLDEWMGSGGHSIDFYLHFAPRLTREKIHLLNGRVGLADAEIIFPEKTPLELLETVYSHVYGQQVPNLTLHLQARAADTWQLPWKFCPL